MKFVGLGKLYFLICNYLNNFPKYRLLQIKLITKNSNTLFKLDSWRSFPGDKSE